MSIIRREFFRRAAALTAVPLIGAQAPIQDTTPEKQKRSWPLLENEHTPKLVMGCQINADAKAMRRLKQLGVNYVSTVWGTRPWTKEQLLAYMAAFREQGLTIINVMYIIPPAIVLDQPGKDQEIEYLQQSLRVAGECNLPTVEYNFYVDRLVEGYFEATGRGGAGLTAFDYSRVKNLPPKPEIGIHKAPRLWSNIEYMLKAVIPVAEKAGVRMALHPNDPVAQESHGSDQIVASLAGLKKLISLVDSPANGITFDCGVLREMGEDAVEACRYFASRDRINHVHYRNVVSEVKYDKYVEVFPDEGQVNMYEVMRELINHHYTRGLYAEHPIAIDYDREHPGNSNISGARPGGGGYAGECFNVGFARAMMFAVLSAS